MVDSTSTRLRQLFEDEVVVEFFAPIHWVRLARLFFVGMIDDVLTSAQLGVNSGSRAGDSFAGKLDKVTLTLTLVFLALLIGYALGKTAAPSLHSLEEHLDAIRSSLEQLTKALCGDKDRERMISMINDDGAELSTEDLAYDGGSLNRIRGEIRGLSDRVVFLAEAASKKNI
jgi:preprotein translocase subunit SecG